MLSHSRASRLRSSGCDEGEARVLLWGKQRGPIAPREVKMRKRPLMKTWWRRERESEGDAPRGSQVELSALLLRFEKCSKFPPKGRGECSSRGKMPGFGHFLFLSFKELDFHPKEGLWPCLFFLGTTGPLLGVSICCSLRALALCPAATSVCTGIGC